LADADPTHGDAYRANATVAQEEMLALRTELAATLDPVAGRPFIVPHDAYQYFEVAFGMPAAGAIALSDATTPGPARIAALRAMVQAGDVNCILTDPQTSPEWSAVLAEGAIARTALVDPDAVGYVPGPDLYPSMLRDMADALITCLTGAG
jgi:zinc transport system substrate-binding protein